MLNVVVHVVTTGFERINRHSSQTNVLLSHTHNRAHSPHTPTLYPSQQKLQRLDSAKIRCYLRGHLQRTEHTTYAALPKATHTHTHTHTHTICYHIQNMGERGVVWYLARPSSLTNLHQWRLTHWGRVTQICVFKTRFFSLHNTLNYAIHRACLRMVLLTDVYRNLTSLWIKL